SIPVETLLSLAGNTLFIVYAIGVFLSATCFAYAVFVIGENVIAGYKETFTESASANMADMFMFIDATRLFYINLLAIVVLPLLNWIILRDLPTTIGVFVLIAIMPGFMYRRMRKKRLKRFEEQLPDGLMMLS